MIDDLLKKIDEAIADEDDSRQDGASSGGGSIHISIGDIVNNTGTVVIGGNVERKDRQEGEGSGSQARQSCGGGPCPEVAWLRRQVLALKQRVCGGYPPDALNALKHNGRPRGARLTSCGPSSPRRPVVPNHRRPSRSPRPRRATARQPAPRRTFRPVMSSLLPPNPTSPYVPYSLSPLTRR
ncbi:hypothetical protein [Halomonas saccharevitans]|uniref:hypothetical protein n=1 Tax=Halomonas saccharevitans TaxID=416872 RepID=UPI0011142329|nr:hypothetical protein [Halomonas saccharevitans]